MMMTMTNGFQPSTVNTSSAMLCKELEFATLLGLVLDPTRNQVALTPALTEQLQELTMVFQASQTQQSLLRPFSVDAWIDLVPWHSFN